MKQRELQKQKETEQRIVEMNKNLEKRMIEEMKKQDKQQLLLAQNQSWNRWERWLLAWPMRLINLWAGFPWDWTISLSNLLKKLFRGVHQGKGKPYV